MGHAADDHEYLEAGAASARFIRGILEREGAPIGPGQWILEWGCASGRVLRHFAPEATQGNVWGVDQHGPSISWCKDHLSPPFRFVTCTAYPHLPFEDGTFNVVYAGSVFTHLLHLMDMWLMEFRRILRPGGHALFTVHDEHTWRVLCSSSEAQKRIVDPSHPESFAGSLDHDVTFLYAGGSWDRVVSFLRSDWIRRDWSQYLDVVSFEPQSESYQTTVVLRKPSRHGSSA
jgi:SAM-dependent methyltransferase